MISGRKADYLRYIKDLEGLGPSFATKHTLNMYIELQNVNIT